TAEMLAKELGARFGKGGTWDEGLAVVRAAVAEAGVPVDQYAAIDGSGLGRSDRLTCATLVDTLDAAGATGPLAAALPVAARSGTLRKRMAGTPAEGRVRAKTGTLDHVASLAGFVDRAGAAPIEFALIANDLPDRTATGRALQDRVALALAAFPDAPGPEAIAPEPAVAAAAPR
ncbi:MAG TPA: D-alanyl-D-alanine carboxypeptidase, partial [Acidimicrobiales bacterium]|nr:D-alanyl-D-alanine carboxypeptidase [Acidimicrobiales bacterium]